MAKKITNIDREACRFLRERVTKRLEKLEGIYGLKFDIGNMSFSGAAATAQLRISTVTDVGEVMTPEAAFFQAESKQYGIPKSFLFKTVTIDGKKMKIVGLKSRQSQAPFLIMNVSTKKTYRISAESLALHLGIRRVR